VIALAVTNGTIGTERVPAIVDVAKNQRFRLHIIEPRVWLLSQCM
jgi:hypothetical protein